MINKSKIPTKLLWLDLEMTGLNPSDDVILEVYAQITDFNFGKSKEFHQLISHNKQRVQSLMANNNFWEEYPSNRDKFLSELKGGKPIEEIDDALADLIAQEFGNELAVLAGNSIHMDRQFIREYLPKTESLLHYRMLDVSAWKIIMQAKYDVHYTKKEVHRAKDDVAESIAELENYLGWFKENNGS